jgi:hypothetical protein
MLLTGLLVACQGGPASSAAAPTANTSSPGSSSGTGSATLDWQAPTTYTNGAPLTDLAGYRIYYGTSASNLSQTVPLNSVGIQTYVIDNLAPGTWYFAIAAVTSTGSVSPLSDIVSKTIG